MATKTKTARSTRFHLPSAAAPEKLPNNDAAPTITLADAAMEPRSYWGDSFAFKVLIAGFVIMALINLQNLVASFFH